MWAIGGYLIVQTVDGYIIVPMVAKRSVDLAPALVLAAQLLFGALFGIIGLMLADPIVAMVKVALERRSERKAASPLSAPRSEEHTSELQSLMRNSYAVFCLKKKK